jgi:hypothetical protein
MSRPDLDEAGRATVELTTGWCGRCEADVEFEQPVCPDHLDDCPELVCTLCSFAFVVVEVGSSAGSGAAPARVAVSPAA